MFKGKTQIELFDAESGAKLSETVEENMFTDAISEAVNNGWTQNAGGLSTINSWHLPVMDKMLNGIVVFDTAIEEKAENIYFPENANVLGYAGTISSDGADKFWGSYNGLESESYNEETRSVKRVWDFATSQCNGTIASLGLSDGNKLDYYGDMPWSKQINRFLDVTSYFSGIGNNIVAFEGDEITEIVNGTGMVTLKKWSVNLTNIKLSNTLGERKETLSVDIEMPWASANYSCCYWRDGGDGYYYGFINASNTDFEAPLRTAPSKDTGASYFIVVIRIDKTTYEVEYHNINTGVYINCYSALPLITKNHIILPVLKSNGVQNSINSSAISNYYNDRICCISLSDWTVETKTLADAEGNTYNMPQSTVGYYTCGMYDGGFQNLQSDGKYHMNGIALDENGIVIRQVNPIIKETTLQPADDFSTYTSFMGVSTCPNRLYETAYNSNYGMNKHRTCTILINKSRSLMVWVGYINGSREVKIQPLVWRRLMTINNLSSPVTKTASQTMKITYTITEAD